MNTLLIRLLLLKQISATSRELHRASLPADFSRRNKKTTLLQRASSTARWSSLTLGKTHARSLGSSTSKPSLMQRLRSPLSCTNMDRTLLRKSTHQRVLWLWSSRLGPKAARRASWSQFTIVVITSTSSFPITWSASSSLIQSLRRVPPPSRCKLAACRIPKTAVVLPSCSQAF